MPTYRLSGERLAKAAAVKGDLSGYAIAKRTGLNQTTLSRLRRGMARPATKTLLALSAAYNISVDELIEQQPENSEAAGGPAPTASSERPTQTA
ncbi:helix-turn-helix transcriptional regulator [Streptomyces cavourensis]|uniref:helix-turn-helix domain-containing protein n=1 Tax=Streptomyces sp. HNA39 TaxID=2850561 RepID=UPI00200E25FC|nr:helix-turn-helix transcriptional regulator [Streptomyces sp. HNA39]UQA34784.1 helix-turn-helix domain-containing protein [Streptomyces sp. HNA39]